MNNTVKNALARALAPAAAALITPSTVRREREHDAVHDGSGQIRAEKVEGRLRPNRAGSIDARSVRLPARESAPALSLEAHYLATDGFATGTGSAWAILTDGDMMDPQIIFADGEVVMVEIPR